MNQRVQDAMQRLALIKQDYLSKLDGQMDELCAGWHALRADAGTTCEPAWSALHRRIHDLAGTAGLFGLAHIGRAAQQLDEVLDQLQVGTRPLDAGEWRRLQGLFDALLGTAQRPLVP
jgi:HPt (histidine-containing phosphotransfer) domain-containing protein